MASKSKVYFFFDNITANLKDRTALKRQVEAIFREENKSLEELRYVFCSDQALLKINRQYLKHDYYTDIITFDLSPDTNTIVGEVYISIDRVKDNAQAEGSSFKSELWRVIFHGALHLCGYNDKTSKEKGIMRKKEDYYLTVSRGNRST